MRIAITYRDDVPVGFTLWRGVNGWDTCVFDFRWRWLMRRVAGV